MRIGRVGLWLSAAACGMAAAAAARGASPVVTIGDFYDGGTVNLAPGDELRVRLPSRPECAWSVAFADAAVLKTLPPDTAAEAGFQAVRFQAAASGSSSLGLVCRATASTSASPSASAAPVGLFRVQVEVKEVMTRRRGLLLEEPDNGSFISMTQGDALSIKLPSNPSTGYTWSIADNAPSVLQPEGDPRFEPAPAARAGAGGFQTFDFRVAGGGAAWIRLVYRRPFEKDAPPARTWSVLVAAAALR